MIDRLRRRFSDPEIAWIIGVSQRAIILWSTGKHEIPRYYHNRLRRLYYLQVPGFRLRSEKVRWLHSKLRENEEVRKRVPPRGFLRRWAGPKVRADQ